jgi:hypothetical protein
MTNLLLKLSLWLCIAVGLSAVVLSTREASGANFQPALGVFFIFIGLSGLTNLRITKVEEMIKEMKEKNERG